MRKKPHLSIVIVNYQTAIHTLTCIRSIFNSKTEINIDVWVVDNGSTDESVDLIKKKYPQVQLIANRQNLFYSQANNLALKKIRSKYFLILNSDVKLFPQTLQKMYEFMENHPDCGLSGCRQIDNNGNTLITSHRSHTPLIQVFMLPIFFKICRNTPWLKKFRYSDWDRRDIKQVDTIPGSFMFGRTKILKQVGYFDENLPLFYSDADLCERVRADGWTIYHNGKTTVTHNVSQTLSRFPRVWIEHQSYRDMVKFYDKHFGPIWAAIVYAFTRITIAFDIRYIFDYLKFTFNRVKVFFETRRDSRRLINQFPNLSQLNYKITNNYQRLQPLYKKYTSQISLDYMAISLEMAAFLLSFCEITQPRTIADLGSGFSSFVFRLYAKETNRKVKIWSVDDDPIWLKKTKEWIHNQKMNSNNVLTWEKFSLHKNMRFNVVFHDLGDMQMRLKTLPNVLKLINPEGFVILDDLQFPVYSDSVKKIIRAENLCLYSLRKCTKDRYGRHASLVHY